MGAEARSQGRRDGEGHQDVWPGQRFVAVVLKPLLGCMLLTLGAVPVAAGMLDTVVSPTGWARREARAVVAALTVWDSADDLAVGAGQMGVALQGRRGKGRADSTQGGHGRSPCMRALRRS